MNEYTIEFKDGLVGLRKSSRNPRSSQALIRSDSAFYEDGRVKNIDELEELDLTALGCSFPFPQIFQLKNFTLICTETRVYTFDGSTLTLVFTCAEGSTWSFADFDTYLVFTNGRVLATLDPVTGVWAEYAGEAMPDCICVCNLNGQLIVGAPEVTVSAGFLA